MKKLSINKLYQLAVGILLTMLPLSATYASSNKEDKELNVKELSLNIMEMLMSGILPILIIIRLPSPCQ